MDDQRRSPAGPPARRSGLGDPVAHRPQAPSPAVPADPPPRSTTWKRLTRSPRGTAGLGIGAAALLLWPFSDWSLLPWLAGLGALVLLALLRLDRLLSGWVWHLAGLVVVGGLMLSTSPWAWALAASIGVLVAGLLQLPAWRLAVVGVALCLVSGVAYTLANIRSADEARAANDLAGQPSQDQITGERPDLILGYLVQAAQQNDPELLCLLLNVRGEAALANGTGTPSCADATALLHNRIGAITVDPPDTTPARRPDGRARIELDACDSAWASAAGTQLGMIDLVIVDPDASTYTVDGFRPC